MRGWAFRTGAIIVILLAVVLVGHARGAAGEQPRGWRPHEQPGQQFGFLVAFRLRHVSTNTNCRHYHPGPLFPEAINPLGCFDDNVSADAGIFMVYPRREKAEAHADVDGGDARLAGLMAVYPAVGRYWSSSTMSRMFLIDAVPESPLQSYALVAVSNGTDRIEFDDLVRIYNPTSQAYCKPGSANSGFIGCPFPLEGYDPFRDASNVFLVTPVN